MLPLITLLAALSPSQREVRIPSDQPGLNLSLRHLPASNPAAPIVLFVHGATFPSGLAAGYPLEGRSWMETLAAAGFDVWALDFLGYGDSARYPEMSESATAPPALGRAKDAARQLALAVDFIGKKRRRVSLIAHSWGTLVAGVYAVEHPDSLDRLVLFGPIGLPVAAKAKRVPPAKAWTCVTAEAQRSRFLGYVPAGRQRVFEEQHLLPWLGAYLRTDAASSTRNPPCVRVPNGPEADFDDLDAGHFPYDPAHVRTPLLVVRGEWDTVSPDGDVRRLLSAMSSAPSTRDVVLSRGTHVMHLEKGRSELYRTVQAFLPSPEATSQPFVVLFEVHPRAARYDGYLHLAAALKPRLGQVPGFEENIRYASLRRPGWLLSLSWWADEKALVRWRTESEHHGAQEKGRAGIFEDYRIRVGQLRRQTAADGTSAAPVTTLIQISCEAAPRPDPEHLLARVGLSSTEAGLVTWDGFTRLDDPSKCLLLLSFKDAVASTRATAKLRSDGETREVSVIRDYGMFDRREAPQYFPPATAGGS